MMDPTTIPSKTTLLHLLERSASGGYKQASTVEAEVRTLRQILYELVKRLPDENTQPKCPGTPGQASWRRCEKPVGHDNPCTHDPEPRVLEDGKQDPPLPPVIGSSEQHYVSTACHHDKHNECRNECKFCQKLCGCICHARLRNADHKLECAFCGKSQREVEKMIKARASVICNECIGLCNDMLGTAEKTPK